ncbi:MAG: hypothetical protein CSA49_00990 [Gammaproteobacteria bacterium]|nr:MAG: hypothetical protein CSA49_00990 [Gammaproteobacteria bacterium]
MKIHQINYLFRQAGEYQLKHRWHFLLLVVILVIIGIAGLPRVESKNARDSWFDDSEAIEIATEAFEDQFGNNDSIGILVEADNVFHPEVLKAIKKLGDELLEKVPYSNEVTSLMETEVSISQNDEIRIYNPFEDGVPDSITELNRIRDLVLSRPSLVNKLVSADATETWISMTLNEYPEPEEWQQETNLDPLFQVGEAAIAIVTDTKWQSDLYTFKAAGLPYSETEERDFFARETMLRVLSGLAATIILLITFLRSIRAVFVPVFTAIMGAVVVFGFMGWLGIGIDANMMTLPILLGMALAVSYSVHLLNAYKRFFLTTGKRQESIVQAVEETGWPIFFTALTTIGSVLSFTTAGIMTIKWLGYTCAAVVLADYLLVMMLVPILMSFGKDRNTTEMGDPAPSLFDKVLTYAGQAIIRYRTLMLIISISCFLAVIPGIGKMTVNMDIFKFMGLKVPYVERLYEVTHSQLGSYMNYNISISFDDAGSINNPEVMKNFDHLLKTVGTFELTKKNETSIFSILDILKDMNRTMHNDDPGYYTVPDERELIAQLLFLYEISGGEHLFKWIDSDYSMLRAQVGIIAFDAKELSREINVIHELGKELFPGADINVVGSAAQFAELNNKIVIGEIKSIGVALIVITVLLIIVFNSLKTGLIGLIPNIAPLVFIAGYMGYTDSPLDMMTMTIMPMLLGIAVDDTIHFINHIKYEFEKTGNYQLAISLAFSAVGKTLAITTIILSITFAMYMFSPVANLFRIGFLASMGLTIALLVDYMVTPPLILLTKPFGKERAPQGG